ncbi:TPA: hypothetical protein ACY3XX_002169 [Yersinia enterocolitica]|uniref:Viral A-type inclusion protein n=5 Tax=Yersinia enterocolitica TaxID=630 RepID=A0A0H3NPS7_YERE1|nr:hypothetical protein [Yersinia enterocolitica]EHB19306.1 Viral A-type inclusion protein [Yersinia enterocolitica subsp. palearctica PhRBD_Ye1]EKN3313611.1 hypothetical protein [Yersinia enterocolitica]EKN3317630.1 hypothetical protein [Yersinia enterocolitica]EKN3321344.1 hypothetical protein [Yersinia enterocolitica]EKN3333481.1 hypothetical protein [Yersinia enterocolitica]
MASLIIRPYVEYDYISHSPSKNNLVKVDRGEEVKERIIQFQQENIKDVDELLLRLLKNNPEFLPGKAVSTCSDTRSFYSENKNKILSNPQVDNAQPIKELINKQMESTVIEMAVNKQIEELRNDNKLKFFPMNPDVVAINFDFDNNNNLIMYQKLQYKEYAKHTPGEANTERHIVCEGEDPYVTIDYYVRFSPAGDVIKDSSNLEITFNGCGDDLQAVFDKRSLWAKICDYFREAFNFHSDVSGMNLMAPELNNKWADEYSEKNSLTGLGSMDNKNQSKDVSVKKEVNDLKLIDSWLKAIDDRKNNNIALRQTGSEKIILFFQKKKQELIPMPLVWLIKIVVVILLLNFYIIKTFAWKNFPQN